MTRILLFEPFHEAQRDFILHVGELLVGFQSLPFERRAPVLEEPSCPALVLVAPELSKGLATYCKPENKVSLGFVEGLNNKIRVIQRRAYGLRDEEYLRLKILTCMLPEL